MTRHTHGVQRALATALALAVGSIVVGPAGEAGAAVRPCPVYSPGQQRGTMSDPALAEVSGLAASRTNPGVLWAHADSGAGAEIHALAADGERLATFALAGATATDWEDIAVGPGPDPGVSYVYVADIGDNQSRRDGVTIYRVPEPVLAPAPGPDPVVLNDVVALDVEYPDGAHDAETLLADPRTGDLYIVTKTLFLAPSGVYRYAAPQSAVGTATLEHVATLSVPPSPFGGSTVTAGDISPSGDEVLLRTYGSAFVWRRGPTQSVAEALGGTRCPVPLQSETQGEAVAYRLDGETYLTTSEWTDDPAPLWEFAAHRQVDGLVRHGTDPFVGDDVYGLRGSTQTVSATLPPRGRTTFTVRVQNEGDRPDSIPVRGDAGNARFRVRYVRNGIDVTAQVVGGTYVVPDLPSGAVAAIGIVVTALPGAPSGAARTLNVTLASQDTSVPRDRVKAVVRRS